MFLDVSLQRGREQLWRELEKVIAKGGELGAEGRDVKSSGYAPR